MKKEQELFKLLDTLKIQHVTHTHAPVYTAQEALTVCNSLPGHHVKNLFLKDSNKKLWLVVIASTKRLNLKEFAQTIGASRVSFASKELLLSILGVEPGSVTPLALINDTDTKVSVVVDKDIMNGTVNFHPLRNDMTTSISAQDFGRFLKYCKNPTTFSHLTGNEL